MFDVECKFHIPDASDLRDAQAALDFLGILAKWLGERDESLSTWYLGGDSKEEALQYEAFGKGPNGYEATKAVLRTRYKDSRSPVVFLWNGRDDELGASLVLSVAEAPYPSSIVLSLQGSPSEPRAPWQDYKATASILTMISKYAAPLCAYIYRDSSYGPKMTYFDRPGVGWMIYLPRRLERYDVPEARAVIPCSSGNTQQGTILVSVTDAVFDPRIDEHVKTARAIETRLVSNDWLPTWAEMVLE